MSQTRNAIKSMGGRTRRYRKKGGQSHSQQQGGNASVNATFTPTTSSPMNNSPMAFGNAFAGSVSSLSSSVGKMLSGGKKRKNKGGKRKSGKSSRKK